ARADHGDIADGFAHAWLDATPGQETLVRAAGAATAAHVRLNGLALSRAFLRLEGRAASTRGFDVRVVDREAGAHERVHIVDLGTSEIRSAEGVDDDADAVHLDLVVAVLRPAVEAEGVLEARTSAALDCDPENRDLALGLFSHEGADLGGRRLGNGDHRSQCTNGPTGQTPPDLVTQKPQKTLERTRSS